MKKKANKYEKIIKTRRIMAVIGLVLIVLLYVWFFALALTDSPNKEKALFAALAATIIIPILMYALGQMSKHMDDYSKEDTQDKAI